MFNKLLVPVDFTSVTAHAAQQAQYLARNFGSEIMLLHVLSKDSSEAEANKKLLEMAEKMAFAHQIKVETLVTKGNIFEDISNIANKENTNLIVMGTHGLQGLQMVTGSKALKVIAKSTKPFLVTQADTPIKKNFNCILSPVFKYKPTTECIKSMLYMAKKSKAKVILISPKSNSDIEKKNYDVNLFMYSRLLEIEEIEYEIYPELASGSNFETRLMQLAVNNSADLISVINLQDLGFFSLPGNSFEQHMITNKLQIPVLVLNPSVD